MIPEDLTFSDAAKYAEAARSLVDGKGMQIHHSFFDPNAFMVDPKVGFPAGFPPLPSMVLSFFFRLLPINDQTVILVGSFFFTLLLLLVFFIAKKYYGSIVATGSLLLMLIDQWWWEYAFNFSSEILFCIEILLAFYLILRRDKYRYLFILPTIVAMFTRQQSSLLVVALAISFVAISYLRDGYKTAIKYLLLGVVGLGLVISISKLDVSLKYSPLNAAYSSFMQAGISPGMYLRGQTMATGDFKALGVKTAYNLYNFLKSPDRLASTIFWLGLFLYLFTGIPKNNNENLERKVVAISLLIIFLLGATVSLPNARYVHPVFPVLYILSACGYFETYKLLKPKGSPFGLFFFIVFMSIPYIGKVTLDQRYYKNIYNFDKPRATRVISDTASRYIDKNRTVVTNMDAWLAWYHGLTTIWFPKEMQLVHPHLDRIDYFFITDYQSGDSDFALNDWTIILDENGRSYYFDNKFKVITRGVIKDSETYENKDIKFVILSKDD